MSKPEFDQNDQGNGPMFDFLSEDADSQNKRRSAQKRSTRKTMPIIRKPVPISKSGPLLPPKPGDPVEPPPPLTTGTATNAASAGNEKKVKINDDLDFLDDTRAESPDLRPVIKKRSHAETRGNVRPLHNADDTEDPLELEQEFEHLKATKNIGGEFKFDNDWRAGHSDYEDYPEERSGGWVKKTFLLVSLPLIVGGGFYAYTKGHLDDLIASSGFGSEQLGVGVAVQPGALDESESLGGTSVDSSTLSANPDSSGIPVESSLSVRFREQLANVETLVRDGLLDEAEQTLASMDRSVYGYGAVEFLALEEQIVSIRGGQGNATQLSDAQRLEQQRQANELALEAERFEAEQARIADAAAEAQRLADLQSDELAAAEARRLEDARQAELAAAETRRLEDARQAEQAAAETRRLEDARQAELAAAEARRLEDARQAEQAAAETRRLEDARQAELAAAETRRLEDARQAELAAAEARRLEDARQAEQAAAEARRLEDARQAELAAAETRRLEDARQAELAAAEARVFAERAAEAERIARLREAEEQAARLEQIQTLQQREREAAQLLEQQRLDQIASRQPQVSTPQSEGLLSGQREREAAVEADKIRLDALEEVARDEARQQIVEADRLATDRRIATERAALERQAFREARIQRAREIEAENAAARANAVSEQSTIERLAVVQGPLINDSVDLNPEFNSQLEENSASVSISNSELETVYQRFTDLQNAISERDITKVVNLTERSGLRVQQLMQVFENSVAIDVRIRNVSTSNATGEVNGTLQIRSIERSDGTLAEPPSDLKSIKLTTTREGDDWSIIRW